MKRMNLQSIQQLGHILSSTGELVPIGPQNPVPTMIVEDNSGAIPESSVMIDEGTTYLTDVEDNNTIVLHIKGPENAEVKFYATIGQSDPFAMPGNKINDLYLPTMTGKNGDALSFSVSLLDTFKIESNIPVTVNGKVL